MEYKINFEINLMIKFLKFSKLFDIFEYLVGKWKNNNNKIETKLIN